MNSKYFLGANSSLGFYSLYDGFCRGSGDYLSIIKGGPGTGKSGFMRRIGAAAEMRGYDVEYVLCSGDSASLDGVYIPAVRRGWMDGTAPHGTEPPRFGVDGDYVDLSRFCRTPLEKTAACAAGELYTAYKAQYASAYGFLGALSSVKGTYCTPLSEREKRAAEKRAEAVFPKRRRGNADGKAARRFLRCLCGEGEMRLSDELEKQERVYILAGREALSGYALRYISGEARRRGFDVVNCLSPLCPDDLEAVIIPEAGIAAAGEGYALNGAKRIELDGAEAPKPPENSLFNCGEIEKTLTDSAFSGFARAKKLHDELEEIYKRAMDFDALTAFTDVYINSLFA